MMGKLFFSHARAIMFAGDSVVKQRETSSGVVHLCVFGFCWVCARFLDVILQVRNQGVTHALFVPPFPNVFLYDTALGSVTQADEKPVANLCYGYGPSEELTSLCWQ